MASINTIRPVRRRMAEDRDPARRRRSTARRARVARCADADDGPAHGGPHPGQPPVSGRDARRGGRARPQHRRRVRGGQGRRAVPARGRRGLDHDHALLVLRVRDDGHGPAHAQGGVGLQRHRAAGRRLPRGSPRGAHPEGPAGLRDLRARRAGRRRRRHPGRRAGQDPAVRPGGSRDRDPARQVVPVAGRRLDGYRRLHRRPVRSSNGTSGCGSRPSTCPSTRGAWRRASTTRSSSTRRSRGPAPTAARDQDRNPADKAKSREELDRDWEVVVRMALITRDLLVGNPRLAELGFGEEALGRNAILGGFQGQRQWTDHSPNGDFMEAILNSSFDWNGDPRAAHLRDGERLAQRRDDAPDVPAHQPGADLRRRADVLEPGRGRAGHGAPPGGPCGRRLHPPDQLGGGDAGCDRRDDGCRRCAGDEAVLGDRRRRRRGGARGDDLVPGEPGLLPRRRVLVAVRVPRRDAGDDGADQPRVGDGAGAPDRGGLDRRPSEGGSRRPRPAHRSHLADALVRAPNDGAAVRSGTCTR